MEKKRVPKRVAEIQVTYSAKIKKEERHQVKCSLDIYQIVMSEIYGDDIEYVETFYVIMLNRSSEILGYKQVSKGGSSGTVVDAKVVFAPALKCHASSILLVHNHPSSSLYPSQPDKNLTKKLVDAGKLLDVLVLDHLIVTMEGYYSFADEGLI